MELNSANVKELFMSCLFNENEIIDGKPNQAPVIGDGTIRQYGFHPQRIIDNKESVKEILFQLPTNCLNGSELVAEDILQRKDGVKWNDSWSDVEELIVLGLAMGLIKDLRLMRGVMVGGLFQFSIFLENPHHNVYDEKHFATRVYFYFKDYENEKAAETACYEHRNSIPNSCTKEIYADYKNQGYYFFLSR